MRFATKLFLVLFWFVMGMFFFVMFSIHGIMGDIPPVTALLGMTCFGLGLLYIACYCAERIARDIYRKLKKDTNIFNPDFPEDVVALCKKLYNNTEDYAEECEPTLFSEEELNNL